MSYENYVSSSSLFQNSMVSADITYYDSMTNGQFHCDSYQQRSYQTDQADFNYENLRLMSLLSWINKHVSKEKLARYGFYYNLQRDYVKCYFCEVVIGDWGIGDDPLTEHHKHSPDCEFINMKPTKNLPIGDELSLQLELKTMHTSLKSGRRDNNKCNTDLIPRHPDYKDEKSRRHSFLVWPKFMRQTPEDLSAAGFFYLGVGDHVKCFFCAGSLKDWEETDTPIEEHRRHYYDQCYFLKENYHKLKQNYPKKYPKSLVKATIEQITELVKYMNEHPDLKEGKINLGSNKALYNQMWDTLSRTLNRFDGPRKTTKAWKEVWRNHKYNCKRKFMLVSTPDITDEKISCKQIKIFHDFNDVPNHRLVEPDMASTFQVSDNAAVLISSNIMTEYQPNWEYLSNDRTPVHKNEFSEYEMLQKEIVEYCNGFFDTPN